MLASCGDALIDFMEVPALDGRKALMPVVGGSCLNVAIGIARLGVRSAYIGALSSDAFGEMIAAHAGESGVELGYADRSDAPSTLAFAHHSGGDVRYTFYDKGSAAGSWRYRSGAIDFDDIEVLHVGSTTLIAAQQARQVELLLTDAPADVLTSIDPNCRPALVTDKRAYADRMCALMRGRDIVRMSDVDAGYLYGEADVDKVAEGLLKSGTKLVVMTKGAAGVDAWHNQAGRLSLPALPADIVDTVGAGDSFQAGLLVGLRALGRLQVAALDGMAAPELERVLLLASTCAARTCTKEGADLPWRADLPGALQELLAAGVR